MAAGVRRHLEGAMKHAIDARFHGGAVVVWNKLVMFRGGNGRSRQEV